jgi:hypothetical protein
MKRKKININFQTSYWGFSAVLALNWHILQLILIAFFTVFELWKFLIYWVGVLSIYCDFCFSPGVRYNFPSDPQTVCCQDKFTVSRKLSKISFLNCIKSLLVCREISDFFSVSRLKKFEEHCIYHSVLITKRIN